MASAITLERCIFCPADDLSEEHIVADWVFRAFAKSRKPTGGLAGTFTAPDSLKVEAADPVQTARVTCTICNNGWLAQIDNDAARVLKPLIRGESEVTLDTAGQTAFAAWIYKCALIFDAAEHGHDGKLASLLSINGKVSKIQIPGYQVMLGHLYAYLGGQVPPIAPESLVGFEQVWPAREEPVIVRPWLVGSDR